MSNRAKNDKASIIVDAKNILLIFDPAFARMPKIRRHHGAAVRFEQAVYDLIDNFYQAYVLSNRPQEIDDKIRYTAAMIGAFGRMQTAFDLLMRTRMDNQKTSNANAVGEMYLLSDHVKLEIARSMEKMEEGISRWRTSLKSFRIMSDERSAQDARNSSAVFQR